jgi:Lrp/AsnC family transcriptional regulator, leucine-responsive regulatory protein
MDRIDRKLLAALQEDAGARYADLAERLHLSAPALHERVKKLKAQGVIRRTTIEVDPRALGYGLCAFIHVGTQTPAGGGWNKEEIAAELRKEPAVEEAHAIAGSTCMILKVRVADADDLGRFLKWLFAIEGIVKTESFISIDSLIDRGPDPLGPGHEAEGA